MKKGIFIVLCSLVLISLCLVGFDYKKTKEPNHFYKVYLNDEVLGIIKSEKKLSDYINKNQDDIKSKYSTKNIYAPKGLNVQKYETYSNKTDSISSIYEKIKAKEPFTVKGYRFTINKKSDNKTEKKEIYVLDKKIFEKAVENFIKVYVGEEKYQEYQDNTQNEIKTTGEILNNVYIDEDITIKSLNISTEEKIYITDGELAKYFLYGDNSKSKKYKVKSGDTIDGVSFKNKISSEELLLSNTSLNSTNNLLFQGQILNIMATNPQISVVTEKYQIKDSETKYNTIERYDGSVIKGDQKTRQKGKNGTDRVTQNVKSINGETIYIDRISSETIKTPIDKIVVKGTKNVPSVGSTSSWGWPTGSGWTITSKYAYRTSPITGSRELHTGIDISGTGYGSKVYATNNGKVMTAEYHYSYGNHVVINHNNGYYSLYAHMSKLAVKKGDIVARGQVIGYVGSTGDSTGPHCHYEMWKGCVYCRINPLSVY